MKYSFERTGELDTHKWDAICAEMRATLDEALTGKYTQEEFAEFFRRAVRDAWTLPRDPQMVFWNFDRPETMPSDGRCDYVYRPTYLMMCTMVAGVNQYPELFELPGVRDAMDRGLRACTGRNFQGHGYEATAVQHENLRLFLRTGINRFIDAHPDFCEDFVNCFDLVFAMMRKAYDQGCHVADWGRNFKEEQEELLALYESEVKPAEDA